MVGVAGLSLIGGWEGKGGTSICQIDWKPLYNTSKANQKVKKSWGKETVMKAQGLLNAEGRRYRPRHWQGTEPLSCLLRPSNNKSILVVGMQSGREDRATRGLKSDKMLQVFRTQDSKRKHYRKEIIHIQWKQGNDKGDRCRYQQQPESRKPWRKRKNDSDTEILLYKI